MHGTYFDILIACYDFDLRILIQALRCITNCKFSNNELEINQTMIAVFMCLFLI